MAEAAGEKTEEPTPRRLEEARRRGQVARSRDLSGAVTLLAAFGVLVAAGAGLVAGLAAYLASALARAAGACVFAPQVAARLALGVAVRALAPPLLAVAAAALAVGLLQTRGLLVAGPLRPDLARLSPAAGLRRLFQVSALVEIGKGLVVAVATAGVAWVTLRGHLPDIVRLAGAGPDRAFAVFAAVGKTLGLRVTLLVMAVGGADFLWQRRRHLRSLRMTRDEVKREHRESEGDPHHKGERLRLHRELAEQRMLAEVRKADFVVVNPDHIAVAIRYDRDRESAPVVVARGERLLAERIKDLAREAGVPIFRDVTLARSLRDVEEGDEIPEALYEAVAEILRVVYRTTEAPASAAAPTDEKPAPGPGPGWRRA